MSAKTTHVRHLDHAVAWDESEQRHVYLEQRRPGVLAAAKSLHVGPGYAGPADSVIDGAGFMAIPGFVNVHSHPFSEPANKGLTEEVGSDKLGQSSLYEFLPVFGLDAEDAGPSTTGGAVGAAEERRHHHHRPLDQPRRLARRSRRHGHPRRRRRR